jgi:hypothetical protein
LVLVGDDTVDGHPGRHVDDKARHRDPVRSPCHCPKYIIYDMLIYSSFDITE